MSVTIHEIPPVFDSHSRILILGSFPSVKSREAHFFYHHPQNRFWKLLAAVFDASLPSSIEEKKALLQNHRIALWDVIASCEIDGSSDSSIRNVVPNDLSGILNEAPIEKIICNGTASYHLYRKHLEQTTGIPAVKLPSTSPANAAYSLERLVNLWKRELIL